MINKKISLLLLTTAVFSSASYSEYQITGKVTHENASFTNNRAALTKLQPLGSASARGSDTFKSETSARIYIDGSMENDSTYHIEMQAFNDSEAVDNHAGNDSYTQRDALREAYIDTTYDDWALRIGKQQVVWGTADGAKLLDIINPTDFSEMAQNQMEDSRIPVWMINGEKPTQDGGNFQFIVSQPRENVFAGLDRGINTSVRDNDITVLASNTNDLTTSSGYSQGQPFVLLGVDSMAGKSNGFVNIVPDLGSVAMRFSGEMGSALERSVNTTADGFANTPASVAAVNFAAFPTIKMYADGTYDTLYGTGAGEGYDGSQILSGFAGAYDTNLMNATHRSNWGDKIDSTFEYMRNATFTTFDTFAGAKSQWKYDMPKGSDSDISMKYANTTKGGTNYSFNYSYAYGKNPIVDLQWVNDSGEKLTQSYYQYGSGASQMTSIYLTDADGTYYGARGYSGDSGGDATLLFTQRVTREHNIGGSFDTSIETNSLGPIVIRGEAVYQKDVMSPIMDLADLSIGDMSEALKMEKGDKFKYVIGADITALTNMMVSLQFIQERNLDFVDAVSNPSGNSNISLPRYTADYATMHLTNGFNKAEKNKEFVSLFLSKPFGESGQHRWNNITMFEDTGGRWNRLDVEYTIDDNTVATAEYNKYWGDYNTQFGQLKDSSNVQLGVKYIF